MKKIKETTIEDYVKENGYMGWRTPNYTMIFKPGVFTRYLPPGQQTIFEMEETSELKAT